MEARVREDLEMGDVQRDSFNQDFNTSIPLGGVSSGGGVQGGSVETLEEPSPIDTIKTQIQTSLQKRKSNKKKRFKTAVIAMAGAALATAGIAALATAAAPVSLVVVGVGALVIGAAVLGGAVKHGLDHTSPGNMTKDVIAPILAGVVTGVGLGLCIGAPIGSIASGTGAVTAVESGTLAPILIGLALTVVGVLGMYPILNMFTGNEYYSSDIPDSLELAVIDSSNSEEYTLEGKFGELLENLEIDTEETTVSGESQLKIDVSTMEDFAEHMKNVELTEGLALLKGARLFEPNNIRDLDDEALDTFIALARKGKDSKLEITLLKESVRRMGVQENSEGEKTFSLDLVKLGRLAKLTGNTDINQFMNYAVQESKNREKPQ